MKLYVLVVASILALGVCGFAQTSSQPAPQAVSEPTSQTAKKHSPIFRATKDQVIQAQDKLRAAGKYTGESTGKLDKPTRAAIKAWQAANGVKPTGTLNRGTLEKMGIVLTEKQKQFPTSSDTSSTDESSPRKRNDPEASKKQIIAVMNEQVEAWNRGDIEGFMKGYWNSPDLVFVSSKVTRGWQPTLDNYKKGYPDREAMGKLTFSELEVTLLSKDSAVVLGRWSLKRSKDEPHGVFTLTFRKFKEGWRIIMDHTS